MINRNNYEEFFMLYVDGELTPLQQKAVDEFVLENPDLREELDMLQQTVLPAEPVFFEGKNELLKGNSGPIHEGNYEEYFLLSVDNELNETERGHLDYFLETHPALRAEMDLLMRTKLEPDTDLVFANKEILYREEKRRPVVYFYFTRLAAAAILFALGFGIYSLLQKSGGTQGTANNASPAVASENTNPSAGASGKKDQPVTLGSTASLQNNSTLRNTAGVVVKKEKHAVVKTQQHSEEKKEEPALVAKIESPSVKEEPLVTPNNSVAGNTVPEKVETAAVAKTETQKKADLIIDQVAEIPNANLSSDKDRATFVSFNGSGDEEMNIGPASFKKNKLRGFFRKVGRVFDKTTSSDSEGRKVVAER